jgi:hypothetical protein
MVNWGLASWLDLWFIVMALEAVDVDGGVVVATLAKIGVRRRHAVGYLAGMAIDTGFQAVWARAYATSERLISLVLEQLHVIAPHESRVSHALATPGSFHYRLWHARDRCIAGKGSPPDQQTKQGYQNAKS